MSIKKYADYFNTVKIIIIIIIIIKRFEKRVKICTVFLNGKI